MLLNQVIVARFIARLSGEGELDVNFRRRWNPESRKLRRFQFVLQSDFETANHFLTIRRTGLVVFQQIKARELVGNILLQFIHKCSCVTHHSVPRTRDYIVCYLPRMSISRRRFFRGLVGKNEARTNFKRRVQAVEAYVRTNLLPYDFAVTGEQTAEALAAAVAAIEINADGEVP